MGKCVRLVSLLFPFVSLLVDHCVRLVSLLLSFVSFLSPSCWSLCPPRPFCLPLSRVLSPFCFVSALSSFCFFFVSGLVPLVVGHCVRLVSLLFPFVSLLVGHCARLFFVCLFVSLHCVRMSPFCLPLSPVLSRFCFVSALSSFCFFLFLVLSHLLLVTVSVLSPFCFLLSPFLLVIVSALSPFVSGLVSLLVGHCVRLVSLLFVFFSLLVPCVRLVCLLSFTCASSLPLSLATLHICLPALPSAILYICHPALGRMLLAILYICLPVSAFVSSSGLLWPPLPCNPLFASSGRRKL